MNAPSSVFIRSATVAIMLIGVKSVTGSNGSLG